MVFQCISQSSSRSLHSGAVVINKVQSSEAWGSIIERVQVGDVWAQFQESIGLRGALCASRCASAVQLRRTTNSSPTSKSSWQAAKKLCPNCMCVCVLCEAYFPYHICRHRVDTTCSLRQRADDELLILERALSISVLCPKRVELGSIFRGGRSSRLHRKGMRG